MNKLLLLALPLALAACTGQAPAEPPVATAEAANAQPENAKPAGLGDVTAPTAEVGREIPVLFGERDLEGPNIVWYGHFRAVPIKKKGGKK